MSTLRLSRSRLRRSPCRGTAARPGFTLIELLVVVAIIALLISILLPSLRAAREQARGVVCGQRLKDFGTGLQVYVNNNEDWIPGINTSGVSVRALRLLYGSNPSVLYRKDLPVQSYDWITPIMCSSTELPAVRAERWKFIVDKLRCPNMKATTTIYSSSGVPDYPEIQARAPWPAGSYLMSAHFQFVGQNYANMVLGYWLTPTGVSAIPVTAKAADPAWEVKVDDYLPNISRVGDAARKIFAADGTRYLDQSELLDFDANPDPGWFGSFTCSGGWWSGSTAYGVAPGSSDWSGGNVSGGSPSRGLNLGLTYRHSAPGETSSGDVHGNKGRLEAAFFDGHVEAMTDRKTREVHLWYPSGAVVQTPSEGLTYAPPGLVIP